MSAAPRRPVTDAWSIDDGYEDALGVWRPTTPATRAALRRAMGAEDEAPPPGPGVRVVGPDGDGALGGPADLVLEDGTVLAVERALPPDLPLGYHRLVPRGGGEPVLVIATPGRCWLPEGLRTWGWALQLPALRSAASWGLGDFADLRRIARWSARELGAGVLLVNPLAAATPAGPQQASPYYPSSRRYRNPLYLRVEEVPGAERLGPALASLAAEGRALGAAPRLDRDRVFALKRQALERLWQAFGGDPAFDRWSAAEGGALADFATFCALAETHGADWRRWPAEHRHPRAPGVARFAAERRERVDFHRWLQWLLDAQHARAAAEIALLHDLPIGVDPGGADAWAWQDLLAGEARVGAPPDRYIRRGQDWGLPPFVPHRLRAAGYAPFVETLRASLRHAGGLRIDHVMGLFRLFWIPPGASPAEGAYVRYRADELLAIVALESHRAQALVVGEDLGTVEAGVRERLAAHRILSCRVFWLEQGDPAGYPALALAAVTTHDLPTVAGLWSGRDLAIQRALGLAPDEDGLRAMRGWLAGAAGVAETAPVEEVVLRAHARLAATPAVVVTAALEDALGVEERPNLPGTTTAVYPSWSIPLPLSLEEIERAPRVRALAAVLAAGRRAPLARPPRSVPS